MKILVPVKRVVDYNVEVRVKPDGSAVDIANVDISMNPFDKIDVQEALRQREAGLATEVIVVSCGDAMSGDAAYRVGERRRSRDLVKSTEELQPLAVAEFLKALVDKDQPQLIILGKQAIDDDSNQTDIVATGRNDGFLRVYTCLPSGPTLTARFFMVVLPSSFSLYSSRRLRTTKWG